MRGEDLPATRRARKCPGSPPHAWGRRPRSPQGTCVGGFTPTCVGKTTSRSSDAPARVYPHVRGEDPSRTLGSEGTRPGKSPRQVAAAPWCRSMLRSPCALSSMRSGSCSQGGRTPVPPMRHNSRSRALKARGQDWVGFHDAQRPCGCTPTYVGKTSARRANSWRPSVHPHVRGEDRRPFSPVVFTKGSPPRTWGRLDVEAVAAVPAGFTPTYVGTTRRTERRVSNARVHPHVRGEDCPRSHRRARPEGSPPRTWGRLPAPRRAVPELGFTPTYVGKTLDGCWVLRVPGTGKCLGRLLGAVGAGVQRSIRLGWRFCTCPLAACPGRREIPLVGPAPRRDLVDEGGEDFGGSRGLRGAGLRSSASGAPLHHQPPASQRPMDPMSPLSASPRLAPTTTPTGNIVSLYQHPGITVAALRVSRNLPTPSIPFGAPHGVV